MELEQYEFKFIVFYFLIGVMVALFGPTEHFEFSFELLTRVNCKTTHDYIIYWMGFSGLVGFEIFFWPLRLASYLIDSIDLTPKVF
jgi:hypothetical protein